MPLDSFGYVELETPVLAPIPAVVRCLRRARRKLSRGYLRGLSHNNRRWPWRRYCLMGAIWNSTPDHVVYIEAMRAVAVAIGRRLDVTDRELEWQLFGWNDAPGRTREEVLAAVGRAIVLSKR